MHVREADIADKPLTSSDRETHTLHLVLVTVDEIRPGKLVFLQIFSCQSVYDHNIIMTLERHVRILSVKFVVFLK